MRRSRLLIQTAAAGALMLSLTGCGSDNPKPAPAPAPARSTTASTSPTPEAAPTMPAEAKETSEAAAKAFVKHFVETLTYAEVTGDTADFRTLYSDNCAYCEGSPMGLTG